MRPLAIAIAGCGPAGLAAAVLLGRHGHRVRLFERFETPRPVGSGLLLQPTGMAVLERLGLAERIREAGAPVRRLHGVAEPSGRTVLDVSYRALPGPERVGIGLHRAALFETLYGAVAQAGIPVETGRSVAGSEGRVGARTLAFADGSTAGPFDLVVDALGAATPLAPPSGRTLPYGALWATVPWPDGTELDPHTLAQRYRRASVMAGILPIGQPPGETRPHAALFWSIRLDRLDAWREAGLAAWKAEALALWPALAPFLATIDGPERLIPARYAHRSVRQRPETGLIFIGDAWHSASPQLGQGANMALLDAWALAAGLRANAHRPIEEGLREAVGLRRRHVALYQAMTALFTPVYQSDSRLLPFIRDRVVAPASRLRAANALQAAMVAGLVGSPLRRLGLEPAS